MTTMRSQPYTPPSPLPRTITDLLPLPRKTSYRSLDDSDAPMPLLPSDAHAGATLLPARRQRHHVWIQGRLAEVKSVSTANLRGGASATSSPTQLTPGTAMFENGVGGRPHSARGAEAELDDGACEEEEERREVVVEHCQLRGYGIGGAGNIRRPTDVIHGPTRFSRSRKNMSTRQNMSTRPERDALGQDAALDKQRFSLREFLGRRTERKGKARDLSR